MIEFLNNLWEFLNPDMGNVGLAWAWAIPVGMAALNMYKNETEGREARRRQAAMRAAEIRAMPWNGRQAPQTQISANPGLLGSGIQGFASGMGLQQSITNAQGSKPFSAMAAQNNSTPAAPPPRASMFGTSQGFQVDPNKYNLGSYNF